jgi:enoyl-CoA hydratase/carnithine racemase
MEKEELVLTERVGRVARLTLNNPDKRNAMTYAMVEALVEALRQADADPDVRAVVIAAAGDHFCAGGDLKEFAGELGLSAMEHWRAADPWIELFQLVRAMRVPVIGAVQGYALAGGCGLVALCDLAIAADDAQVGTTEIRIGLFPMIVYPALRRVIGERKALEMALTGKMFNAQEALAMGLVNQVVPRSELPDAAIKLAAGIAAKGPAAVTLGKHLFYATQEMGYDEALAFARNIRAVYMLADDVAEGVDAFLNKRKPNWG